MKTVAEADADNKITRYYIYGAGLIAMVTPADKVYCYHYNAIGSTIAITDQEQNLVNKYAYAPFGEILNQEEEIPQPFKFVGRYGVMSEPSGYYYMRARYYDTETGRFISEDPMGFEGGDVNLYAYAGNNPMLVIDPLGLCGEENDPWWESTSPFSFIAASMIHYDTGKMGEKIIHIIKDKWDFHFNRAGDVVEHSGKFISKATEQAAKALKYLKNIKSDYFLRTPIIFIIPPELRRDPASPFYDSESGDGAI